MRRRDFLLGGACSAVLAATPALARAGIPSLSGDRVLTAYDWNAMPPMDSQQAFIDWMAKDRGEDPNFLGERFDRFVHLVRNHDLWNDPNKRAFLMTPREDFVLAPNLPRAYDNAFLDINYGVTISGPHLVGRMTSSIDVHRGEKVLEVGTGSGYQSAYLSNLTDKVWTIEIIKPLFERTGGIYADLIAHGYTEYKAVTRKNDDGYYGWPEAAPVRQDHRHLRHRPCAAAASPAAEAQRNHGHPGRPAGRPARAEDHQGAGQRQLPRRPLGHLQRPHRALRALHQAGRRQDRRHAQWRLTRSMAADEK